MGGLLKDVCFFPCVVCIVVCAFAKTKAVALSPTFPSLATAHAYASLLL